MESNHIIDEFNKRIREDSKRIEKEYYAGFGYTKMKEQDYSDLMYACAAHDLAKVKILISNGADVNYVCNNYSVLLHASAKSTNFIVAFLISKGADVNFKNQFNETPLMYACHYHNADIIEILLQCGADVNASCDEGYTPLMIACKSRSYDDYDIVKTLLNHGADKTLKNKKGFDALHYAESIKDDIVSLLK